MPAPGRKCGICSHPEAAAINRLIGARGSKSDVADRFGVSRSAVQRHRHDCLHIRFQDVPAANGRTSAQAVAKSTAGSLAPVDAAEAVRFGPRDAEAPIDPRRLITRAEWLLDDAQAILSRAAGDGNDRLALQAVRETRASLELLMKAHGMITGDAQPSIDSRTVNVFAGWDPDDVRKVLRQLASEPPRDELAVLDALPVSCSADNP